MVFVAVEVVGWKSHAMICLICVQLSLFELPNSLKTLAFVDDSLCVCWTFGPA